VRPAAFSSTIKNLGEVGRGSVNDGTVKVTRQRQHLPTAQRHAERWWAPTGGCDARSTPGRRWSCRPPRSTATTSAASTWTGTLKARTGGTARRSRTSTPQSSPMTARRGWPAAGSSLLLLNDTLNDWVGQHRRRDPGRRQHHLGAAYSRRVDGHHLGSLNVDSTLKADRRLRPTRSSNFDDDEVHQRRTISRSSCCCQRSRLR